MAHGKMEGRGLYDDGGSHRPEGCTKEIAFADSPGAAAYGALQNSAHNRLIGEQWPTPFFGDKLAIDSFIIYETEEEPDYHACSGSMDDTLGVETDFCWMGEVRYCNREVKVKPVCSIPITEHDMSIATTVLFKSHPYHYFDFDDFDPQDQVELEGYEEEWRKIIEGDEETIAKRILDFPEEKAFNYGEGLDSGVVIGLIGSLGRRCKVV